MLNGAYFITSGAVAADNYALASSLGAKPALLVETITGEAGALQGRTQSSNGKTHMSVSAAPMSKLSASHSHQIIYFFFLCTGCLTALNVVRFSRLYGYVLVHEIVIGCGMSNPFLRNREMESAI
uniref:Uncharacterized protein n=1 Tax=Picea sitchensis TaxID=3332 RepID=A9NNW2_PICSI|nr:unknown [Picea sitchensis]